MRLRAHRLYFSWVLTHCTKNFRFSSSSLVRTDKKYKWNAFTFSANDIYIYIYIYIYKWNRVQLTQIALEPISEGLESKKLSGGVLLRLLLHPTCYLSSPSNSVLEPWLMIKIRNGSGTMFHVYQPPPKWL